ncbi:MAG: MarR family winged helix-turn-helix transcriptional regulator [Chloroflexota bacterium]
MNSGYLERQISPDDARVKVLVLTDAGLALQDKISHLYQQMVEQLLDDVSPAERLLLAELLQKLIQNIEVAEIPSP